MSNGSSSTSSRISLPLVTLIDRLARLGEAVAGLGVGQRAPLVDAVQVGAREPVRLALVEVRPPARCARWTARTPTRSAAASRDRSVGLPQRPRLDRERRVLDHRSSSSSARSLTTMSAPGLAQRVGLPDPVHADHEPEVAGPPGGDPGQRVLEDDRVGGRDPQGPGACEVGVRGGLARPAARALRHHAVDDRVEQVADPGRGEHAGGVGAGGHHRAAQPGLTHRVQVADRARVGAAPPDQRSCAARSGSSGCPARRWCAAPGGSSALPSGSSIPRACRNERVPSARGLPSTYSS